MEALEAFLRQGMGRRQLTVLDPPDQPPRTSPMLTTRFDTPVGEMALSSMFTNFGSPRDMSLASLRVNNLRAADAAT